MLKVSRENKDGHGYTTNCYSLRYSRTTIIGAWMEVWSYQLLLFRRGPFEGNNSVGKRVKTEVVCVNRDSGTLAAALI